MDAFLKSVKRHFAHKHNRILGEHHSNETQRSTPAKPSDDKALQDLISSMSFSDSRADATAEERETKFLKSDTISNETATSEPNSEEGGGAAAVSKKNEKQTMLSVVEEALEKIGYGGVSIDKDNSQDHIVVRFLCSGDVGVLPFYIILDESKDYILVYCRCPCGIKEAKREKACVYLTYVNFGLKSGYFELDMSDGEVRYKVTCSLKDSHLSTTMVMDMLGFCQVMVDQFVPGLMSVIYSNTGPKEAYDNAMNSNEEQNVAPQQ